MPPLNRQVPYIAVTSLSRRVGRALCGVINLRSSDAAVGIDAPTHCRTEGLDVVSSINEPSEPRQNLELLPPGHVPLYLIVTLTIIDPTL